jgi:two-component system, cell cycle sensor histidine kinase and response regulator CckA
VYATVLVVEDQLDVRALMVRALIEQGYRVLEAGDGHEALEILGKEPAVQLVVTDIVMPRLDGYELARRLAPTRIPVLFVSGYGDRYTVLPGPLLEKPFSPVALTEAVERLLDRAG